VTVCALSSAFAQTQPAPQTAPVVVQLPTVQLPTVQLPTVPLPTVPGAPSLGTPQSGDAEPTKPLSPDGKFRRPLTAEEKLQLEIEKFDPLSKTNPAKPEDPDAVAKAKAALAQPKTDNRNKLAPLPGSVAESNLPDPTANRGEGPEVVSDSDASNQSYNGPAVLSRSYTLTRPTTTKQVQWSWNVTSGQSYSVGLVSGAATGKNAATNQSSYGTNTGWALSGRHAWKRDNVGLSYSVSFSEYPWASSYSGINQSLSADYGHQFSRRLMFHISTVGSMTPPSATLDNPLTAPGVSIANLSLSASPSLQPLDIRTRQFQNSAALSWQKSARLSFSVGGGFFAVDRTGGTLSGNIGYQAQADVNYRLDAKTTVGLSYSWTNYIFAKHQSLSDTNTVGVIFSRAFGPSTQLRTRFGVSEIESMGYNQVAIDPLFVALIGSPTTIVDSYHKSATSDISAQLIKDFKGRKTASISYARGVSPGNGLILTAIQETMTLNFTTTVFRRYPFTLTAGRNALASQAQNTGGSTSDFVSVGTSRSLIGHANSSFSVQYSRFAITNMPGLHSQFSVNTSVSWGPGPGKIW
jgi:hypothetical protein